LDEIWEILALKDVFAQSKNMGKYKEYCIFLLTHIISLFPTEKVKSERFKV